MNPMQLMQMIKNGNPQQLMQQLINSNPEFQNPIIQNAMDMANKGDFQGVEQLTRNLCKEKNIDVNKALSQIKSQFGIQ